MYVWYSIIHVTLLNVLHLFLDSGSNLLNAQCAKFANSGNACFAAFLALHLTSQSSAYIEGLWAWLADHDLDSGGSPQISLFSGRGIYSESQGPVWLVGTGSEHHIQYQYYLNGAKNHYIGLAQTESVSRKVTYRCVTFLIKCGSHTSNLHRFLLLHSLPTLNLRTPRRDLVPLGLWT